MKTKTTAKRAASILKELFRNRKSINDQIAVTTPIAFPIGSEVSYMHNGRRQIVTVDMHGGCGEQLRVYGKSPNPYWIYVYRVLDDLK